MFDGGCFVRFYDGVGLVIGFDVLDMVFNGINFCELCYWLVGS